MSAILSSLGGVTVLFLATLIDHQLVSTLLFLLSAVFFLVIPLWTLTGGGGDDG